MIQRPLLSMPPRAASKRSRLRHPPWSTIAVALVLLVSACGRTDQQPEFFGKVRPPDGQVLRYVSGSEPESLDPQIGTGQPEARIYMALFEGLVEYDPKTGAPIPAIAESWEINSDSSEFLFRLRQNAQWSDGRPITAPDFVYTFRRGVNPELAARNAYLAYEIKYAQAYNEGACFVRDKPSGQFLLEKDFSATAEATAVSPAVSTSPEPAPTAADTEFHRLIRGPARLTVAGDPKARDGELKSRPKLKAALSGKELVPVHAEDIGVEAVDPFTFRVTLRQSAPYFLGLMAHQFFRAVNRHAIERFGDLAWTQPRNIVTSGPFRLAAWKPYDELVVRRDPAYWDAATVRLDEIHFYAIEDQTTMQNLYKAGELDATYNHTVPAGWLDEIKPLKDYMDAPEAANEFYNFNVARPPMNDVRTRQAFNLAIDKVALAEFRKSAKPLLTLVPSGIFLGYPPPKVESFNPERARRLLAAAGYADASGNYDASKFPIDEVELTYNTAESNRQVAEFVQAQWKQNLGLTVPLKNMEFKTFLQVRAKLEFKGVARGAWGADYMDPYTFLVLFSTDAGDNGTGWFDPKYVAMLNEANRQRDQEKRYALLAKAEAYLLEAQPVIPLLVPSTSWMKKPYVKGMYPNPQTVHPWKFVYIERDPAKWDRAMPSLTHEQPAGTGPFISRNDSFQHAD